MDWHDQRTCYSPKSNGLNYIGIIDDAENFNPTNSDTWEINGKKITPSPNDMIVVGTKEYYLGSDNAWHEIGDEDSPQWHEQ